MNKIHRRHPECHYPPTPGQVQVSDANLDKLEAYVERLESKSRIFGELLDELRVIVKDREDFILGGPARLLTKLFRLVEDVDRAMEDS